MLFRPALAAAVLLACALSGGAPAGAADPALVASAQKEGQVVWYTGFIINQLARPLADAFEKKYRPPLKPVSYASQGGILRCHLRVIALTINH